MGSDAVAAGDFTVGRWMFFVFDGTIINFKCGAIKVAYTVNHNRMNLDGSTYSLYSTDNLVGKKGKYATPTVNSYTGFTSPSAQTVRLSKGTVVNYNYSRNGYYLTVNSASPGLSTSGSGSKYYQSNSVINAAGGYSGTDYYSFSYWGVSGGSLTGASTTAYNSIVMPANAVTATAYGTITERNLMRTIWAASLVGSYSCQLATQTSTLNLAMCEGSYDGWGGVGLRTSSTVDMTGFNYLSFTISTASSLGQYESYGACYVGFGTATGISGSAGYAKGQYARYLTIIPYNTSFPQTFTINVSDIGGGYYIWANVGVAGNGLGQRAAMTISNVWLHN